MGDSRDDVLARLGKPVSIARRGDHEIFLYPKGGRLEFVDGKLVDAKGPLSTAVATTAPISAPAAAPAKSAPTAKVVAPSAPKTTPATLSPAIPDFHPAIAANELAQSVEKMDTAWGAAPVAPKTHSPFDSLPEFFTGLVLRFGFTILALKLAFKYWEMDAFWAGIFAIAGIDLALHAGLELLGPVSGGFTTLSGVENGIPGLVLIFTVRHFCFNKRLQNAVLTAAAVKLVVTLCYMFAGLALLNAIYG